MNERYRQLLYCTLTDGAMTYPVFVEVQKGSEAVDLDYFRRGVSEHFQVPLEDLRVASHPRWATRIEGGGGHVLHVGMLPVESAIRVDAPETA
jgi:hypothetical protein